MADALLLYRAFSKFFELSANHIFVLNEAFFEFSAEDIKGEEKLYE